MRKLLFTITIAAFCYTQDDGGMPKGTVWGSFGLAPTMTVGETDPLALDGGDLTIGYNQPVYAVNEKIGIQVGLSYAVMPMSVEMTMEMGDEVTTSDNEYGFASFYALPTYLVNDKIAIWSALGMGMPTTSTLTDQDASMGLLFGLGLNYRVTEKIGLGLGYVMNKTTTTEDDVFFGTEMESDHTFSRIGLFLGYSL